MELTPRTAPDAEGRPPIRRRSPWAYGALVVVLVGLAVVIWQGLTSASLYFYNADEAVEQRDDLGDRRFGLHGVVLAESIDAGEEEVRFAIAFNGARVDVHHDGDPPELFQPGIPVVLEGRWAEGADHFASDTIKVKHSEQYEEDHGDRLDDAEDGEAAGAARSSAAAPASP